MAACGVTSSSSSSSPMNPVGGVDMEDILGSTPPAKRVRVSPKTVEETQEPTLHFGSLKTSGIEWEKIEKNASVYKRLIRETIEWVSVNNEDPHIRTKFHTFYATMARKNRIFLKKSVLIYYYREMVAMNEIVEDPLVQTLLQKRPSRNASGVTVITVLTSPYPSGQKFSCKHNCYYCPNEPDMPRSYLKDEPAVSRGFRNKWSAREQMLDRMRVLQANGHELDKLEIIIEGGTYTEYPPEYLEKFHEELIYTANTFYDKPTPESPEVRESQGIDAEVAMNATARCRIIGICVETRPDALMNTTPASTTDTALTNSEKLTPTTTTTTENWLRRFRRWGVTRVQLGLQHTDDEILRKVNRGHTVRDAEYAIKYLKDNGFKVDIHIMPDLPGSSPEKDAAMFRYLYDSPSIQPDQMKVYPCEVVPWTVIQQWHKSGKYSPYAQTNERALLDVVKGAIRDCPPWIRLPRVIRDIPLSYIEGGNMYPNLRQMLEGELKKEGVSIQEIRARECTRHPEYNVNDAVYRMYVYNASGGREYFIACESDDSVALFGFLRLRFPSKRYSSSSRSILHEITSHTPDTDNTDNTPLIDDVPREFECLTGTTSLVRELHVYGNVLRVGSRNSSKYHDQHRGIGTELLRRAEIVSREMGYTHIAVISGIGVTEYYRKRGYTLNDYYMVKPLEYNLSVDTDMLVVLLFMFMMTSIVCIMLIMEIPDNGLGYSYNHSYN